MGQRNHFFERAPAIASQVYNQPRDIFFFQPAQQHRDILCRALGVMVHVRIEGR